LSQLAAAADVTGIARGVAFQLVEALGVLDRQRVAEEVKGLDQAARATLRKYGVRFGAYHIYLPMLLKPAPRALAAQFWALRHAGPQSKGLEDLLQLAGSGRTSMPIDREIDPSLYRTAGYRACGERAVRVDILERLADLIRPALGWREGAGAKPPGAVAGGGFTIVNGMTSLTGASGEDFASILRSLGYRMERRPKPPEPVAEPIAVETPVAVTAEPAAIVDHEAAQQESTPQATPAAATPEEAVATAEASEVAPHGEGATEGQDDRESALQPPPDLIAAMPSAEGDAVVLPSDASSADSTADAATPAAGGENETIEVWRPGRPEGRHRPRHRGRDTRRPSRSEIAAAPRAEAPGPAAAVPDEAATLSPAGPAGEAEPAAIVPPKLERHPRHRRHHHAGEHRPDRPQRDRERPPQVRPARFERREKAPDPNSPFAKLAALKAQLEADAKERR
jgi:ATP-dependent RNA helicase SUPV3L1/SUV3